MLVFKCQMTIDRTFLMGESTCSRSWRRAWVLPYYNVPGIPILLRLVKYTMLSNHRLAPLSPEAIAVTYCPMRYKRGNDRCASWQSNCDAVVLVGCER